MHAVLLCNRWLSEQERAKVQVVARDFFWTSSYCQESDGIGVSATETLVLLSISYTRRLGIMMTI